MRRSIFQSNTSNILDTDQGSSLSTMRISSQTSTYNSPQYDSPNRDSLDSLLKLNSNREQPKQMFFSQKVEPYQKYERIRINKIPSDEEKYEKNEHKIDLKNDVEAFFNNPEIPRAKRIKRTNLRNQYYLQGFTEWVENIYGPEWFHEENDQKKRRNVYAKRSSIEEFFTSIC
ncbi:hypothetical protein pb186bvf_001264 [Paramecium bursaria]